MGSKHASKVQLIPWDHTSEEQVTRLYEQRVACGWRFEQVPSFVESAAKGGRIFYWVVLADTLPEHETLLKAHIARFPKEAGPIHDTAREVRLSPREPTGKEFIPVGHVALEIHSAEEDAKFGLPAQGVVWIHQLYISYALQQVGLGAGTMDLIEAVASQKPFDGNLIVLDTIQQEMQLSGDGKRFIYEERGVPVPKVATQIWYTRRGYEVFLRAERGYEWDHGAGTVWFDIAYMSKSLEHLGVSSTEVKGAVP